MTPTPPEKPVHRPLAAGLVVLVCVLAGSGVAAQEADAVRLRPQWSEGQSARYQFWTTRTQATSIRFGDRTQDATVTLSSEGEVVWTVDRVKGGGGYECTMTLDWMAVDRTADGGNPARNDSRKSKGDVPFVQDLLKAMAGKPLKVTVNADGSVESVGGVQAMVHAAENAEAVPEELDFIETASDLATLVFVPEVVAVGDDWDASFRWTHELGHLEQDWTYRFTGTEEIAGVPVAVVTGETTGMKLDPDTLREEMPKDSPPVKVDLKKAEGQLRVLFDLTRHEAVGRDGRVDTTVAMSIPLPDGRSIDRTIHETITSQTLRVAEQ